MKKALLLLVAFSFVATACSSPQANNVPDPGPVNTNTAPAAPAGVTKTVVLYNYKFNPNTLAVPAGSTIVFKNKDPEQHNVNIANMNIDRMLNSNESFEVTFSQAGTYQITNRLANTPMKFTLTVQ